MLKPCFKCRTLKPISEFYAHPQMADGHLNKCKVCARKDSAARIAKMKRDPAWIESERARSRAKIHRYRHLTSPAAMKRARDAWGMRNPHKLRVQGIAFRAQRKGLLIKPAVCQRCQEPAPRLEKHHEDYSKPLTVEWLCPKCHGITKRKPQLTK